MKGKRILIAGCGYVGARLAALSSEAGHTVFTLRRSPGSSVTRATAVSGDLCDPRTLERLPEPLDAVVFAAAPSSHDEEGYRRIFVDGLRNLIDALTARAEPPTRLIFTSSTAVYGQSRGEWVDERSPARPRRFNGRVLLEAESLLLASGFPGCSLRLGGIYGPGRTRLIDRVRNREARLAPGPPQYTNRIHREDAARALLHLLTLERVETVYLGVDGEPAARNEVLRFLAAELGLEPPPLAESAPEPRAGGKRCRNDRLLASGYRFVYASYREGYGELLRRA